MINLVVFMLCLAAVTSFHLYSPVFSKLTHSKQYRSLFHMTEEGKELETNDEEEVTSREIKRLRKNILDLNTRIQEVEVARKETEEELKALDEEYGSEISRIKKEFARIKERSIEEAVEISNKAKVDAVKEVLAVSDNYVRAKSAFKAETDGEMAILKVYDEVFEKFGEVLADFGLSPVESLGKPFDFNFMEAIMTTGSTEYAKDIVCTEYQVGYKMGDKCVRPAMVVVSTGPGPQ